MLHSSKCLPEIMTVALLAFMLLASCFEVHAEFECTNLTVFNGTEKIDTNSVCYRRYTSANCSGFATSFDKSQLPENFPTWEYSVEAPRNLDVSLTEYEWDGWIYPGMSVRFDSPSSGYGRIYNLGYLVVWHNKDKDELRCYLFQFHNGSAILKNELRYQVDIDVVSDSTNFDVRVYSVPTDTPRMIEKNKLYIQANISTPPEKKIEQLEMTTGQHTTTTPIEPGAWSPEVTVDNMTFDNGTIAVIWTLPPADLNLTMFTVQLSRFPNSVEFVDQIEGHKPGVYSEENKQGIVHFNVNTSGKYKISIWVEDENRMTPGECRCWKLEAGIQKCQNQCGSKSTDWFYVNVTNPVTSTVASTSVTHMEGTSQSSKQAQETTHSVSTTGQPSETTHSVSTTDQISSGGDQDIAAIVGGVLTGVLLIIVVLVLWVKREKVKKLIRKCLRNEDNTQHSEDSFMPVPGTGDCPISIVPLTKKVVYILSADDHEAHTNLVESFAKFLQVHCFCNVINPLDYDTDKLSRYEWFISSVNKSDYILFVDSQGAKSLIMTYLSTIPKAPEDFFNYGLKHLLVNNEARENKLVLVSFQGNHCQSYLHTSTIYTLTENLPKLLRKIHNINAKNKVYDNWLPMHAENIPNLLEGRELLSAIKAVKKYEENNPDWFNSKFRQNLNSIDSGINSSLFSANSLSVSTIDLTSNETASPTSVFGDPNFPAHMNSPTGKSSRTEAMPYFKIFPHPQRPPPVDITPDSVSEFTNINQQYGGTVPPQGNAENISWITFSQSQFMEQHARPGEENVAQKGTVLYKGMKIVVPESVSVINDESISTALNNINRVNTESVSLCIQDLTTQHSSCPAPANMELNEEEFQAGLSPPDTLSNIKIEETISTALVRINADTDTDTVFQQGGNGQSDSIV